MKKVFLILCVVAMTVAMCVGVAAATMGETESEAKENDDFAITVSEVDSDGEIKITTYELEDLSCTIYDVNNNVIYDGPAKVEDPVTRGFSVKASDIPIGGTIQWHPTNDENGFKSGKGIAVTVSVKTNSEVSKTIGLTAGDSSTTTNKNPSAILYTGTDGYWKFYVTNNSSSAFKVTGGSISWGE